MRGTEFKIIYIIVFFFIVIELFRFKGVVNKIKNIDTALHDGTIQIQEKEGGKPVKECSLSAIVQLEVIKRIGKSSIVLGSDSFKSNIDLAKVLKKKLVDARSKGVKVRMSIGDSYKNMPGLIRCDIQELNMIVMEDWIQLVGDDEVCGVDSLFSEHVFEHLSPRQVLQAAATAFLVLREGGRWRVAVPDGYYKNEWYQIYQGTIGNIPTVQKHMVVWTVDSLPQLFEMAGYKVELLEYHDREGKFHKADYDEITFGKVDRTMANDPRNHGPASNLPPLGKGVNMTSLVFDAIKPEDCMLTICNRPDKSV